MSDNNACWRPLTNPAGAKPLNAHALGKSRGSGWNLSRLEHLDTTAKRFVRRKYGVRWQAKRDTAFVSAGTAT